MSDQERPRRTGRLEPTLPTREPTRVPVPRLALRVEGEANEADRMVDGDVIRIGSHPSNEIVVDDPHVSRFHCSLRKTPAGWHVTDTGSRNGTRLDGVFVRDADLRFPESRLRVGDTNISIRAAESVRETIVPAGTGFGMIAGVSTPMRRLFEVLRRAATVDTDVLIEGESGTGKELVASEIVAHSARADGPLVVVDGGAISPSLVESELFGHAMGAFTGATRDRAGAFETADGGTIFLDEIGELPLEIQPKLLRVLAQREVRRVGEERVRPIDVRVIAATNRNLEREVNAGRFREDLYYRLSVITVHVPPLRDRGEDLEHLLAVFLAQLGASDRRHLFDALLPSMRSHPWPGNVRELRNYVERALVLEEDAGLPGMSGRRPSDPGVESMAVDPSVPFGQAKERVIELFERRYLASLLEATGGNVSQAARRGKLDRMHLHRLLQRHGLRPKGEAR